MATANRATINLDKRLNEKAVFSLNDLLRQFAVFLAPIASPVHFARVQWKSFCAGVRRKRLQRIAGKSS